MKEIKDSRVLVVAAHPDDEILLAGCLLAEAAMSCVIILGEGSSCRSGASESEVCAQIEQRKSVAKGIAREWNYSIDFGECVCGQFHLSKQNLVIDQINKVMQDFSPDIVISHFGGDTHQDHRFVADCCDVVMRSHNISGRSITYLKGEVLSSTEFPFVRASFLPDFYVPVDDDAIRTAQAMLSMYEGESLAKCCGRSPEGIGTLARYRGMQIGIPLAVAYKLQLLVL